MPDKALKRFAEQVGYTEAEMASLRPEGPRARYIAAMEKAMAGYVVVAEVVRAANCGSGYAPGTRFALDPAGNFLAKRCPPRICVYLAGQLAIPVALVNERFSQGLDPNGFHFMHMVRCPDAGVACRGYGEVEVEVFVQTKREFLRDSKGQST